MIFNFFSIIKYILIVTISKGKIAQKRNFSILPCVFPQTIQEWTVFPAISYNHELHYPN